MNNLEEIILLIISGQGFLLSLALITSVLKNKYSNFFLGFITLVLSIEIFNIWLVRISYHSSDNPFPFWVFGSYLIIPAAFYLFSKVNTDSKFQLKFKHLIFFIPAIIEILIELFSFFSNKLLNTNYELVNSKPWHYFTEVLPIIGMLFVLFLYAKKLIDISARLKVVSSSKTISNTFRVYVFFILFSFLTLFWILQTIFHLEVYFIIEALLLVFIFILCYIGYFQPTFFDVPKIPDSNSSLSNYNNYDDLQQLKRLESLFVDQKIYIKPKLTLKDVSSELQLPERYISSLINQHHHTNFSHFVNTYRVNDVLKQIKDPKTSHKTLLAIALDSGFNSKSSFNQIFKSITGKTPSEFLKK